MQMENAEKTLPRHHTRVGDGEGPAAKETETETRIKFMSFNGEREGSHSAEAAAGAGASEDMMTGQQVSQFGRVALFCSVLF